MRECLWEKRFTYSNGLNFQERIEELRLRAAVARAAYSKTFFKENYKCYRICKQNEIWLSC
jgi:hypothetical protein